MPIGQERFVNIETERMMVVVLVGVEAGRGPVHQAVGVAGHGGVGGAVSAPVLDRSVVSEAVVFWLSRPQRSFEGENRPVGLRHRAGWFPDGRDQLEGVGSLDLDRREGDVDAGRYESSVVRQKLLDFRGRWPFGRGHAPA